MSPAWGIKTALFHFLKHRLIYKNKEKKNKNKQEKEISFHELASSVTN